MTQHFLPLLKGKASFFTLLLCFSALCCTAQDPYFFELNPKNTNSNRVNFIIDEVIDARVFDKHCGYVPNGTDGQLLQATFKNGMEKELGGLLTLMLKFGNPDHKVALVVREFHINESNQSSDFGQFEMLYDFYLSNLTEINSEFFFRISVNFHVLFLSVNHLENLPKSKILNLFFFRPLEKKSAIIHCFG